MLPFFFGQPIAAPVFRTGFSVSPLALALLLATQAPHAWSEETPSVTEDLEITPLVITGVSPQAPVMVITDPRIPRQPAPAVDGADYLKTIPGFSAVRSGGVNGDPVFRGMFGSRLNLLTNGGNMLGACPNRMDSPSAYITPESFDKLTVIKGPQTVLYGAGASAATILFEREPERFTEPSTKVNMSFLTGSHGRFDRAIDATAGNQLGYIRMLANRSDSDDYDDGSHDTVPSRWEKWSGDFIVGWTPTDDTLLELTYGTSDAESRYAGRAMDGTKFDRKSFNLRFDIDNIGEVFKKIETRLYYNYTDHVMDNFRLRRPDPTASMAMMRNPMASNVERRTLGGRITGTWEWQHYQLKAGVDAQGNEHRRRSSTYMNGQYHDADDYEWDKDADFRNYGIFGELTWHWDDQRKIITGARLDRHYAQDHRNTLSNMGMTWVNPTAGKERGDTLPSGFVRYEQQLESIPATTYIGLGHTQRYPDYWEFFSSTTSMGKATSFERIHPEKTTQLDFGIQYQEGPWEAWASGYLGWVRDFILFDYTTNMMGMTTSSVSNVDARIMGAELGMSYRLTEHWKTDTSLAYAWGKNSSDDRPLPQIPPLETKISLTYEEQDWSTSGLWRIVSKQSRTASGQGNVVGRDFDDSDGFSVFSVNGAYRVSKNLKLSTGIDNLFDKNYSEHLNLAGNAGFEFPADTRINEPGRFWWARADISF